MRTGLPDRVDLAVKHLLATELNRAYGHLVTHPDDEAGACEKCGGDGCHVCWWSGQAGRRAA